MSYDDKILISEDARDEIDLDSMIGSEPITFGVSETARLADELNATPVEIYIGNYRDSSLNLEFLKQGKINDTFEKHVCFNGLLTSSKQEITNEGKATKLTTTFWMPYEEFIHSDEVLYSFLESRKIGVSVKFKIAAKPCWTSTHAHANAKTATFISNMLEFRDSLVKIEFMLLVE